jgi:uracil-DNA glycosylase family 4
LSEPSRSQSPEQQLARLHERVISCRRCPRLVHYREEVARSKRRAFREWMYWGRPVPGFGDPHARLLIVGLAPAAHGANRTGRMFTGDRSGDFLYLRLYKEGFANQPTSVDVNDGLELHDAYISAAARCAPPDNRPLPEELRACAPYLEEEFAIIQPRAVLALGAIAFRTYLRLLLKQGQIDSVGEYHFSHGAEFKLPGDLPHLFASYHPSQQNTQTGKLTPAMFNSVLRRIRRVLGMMEPDNSRR